MFSIRSCHVSFTDPTGIEHTATVTASSLYEAVGLAIRAFRDSPVVGLAPGVVPPSLTVALSEATTQHTVTGMQFKDWLARPGGAPRDVTLRHRLKELLA